MSQHQPAGRHAIGDGIGANAKTLDDATFLDGMLSMCVTACGATVLKSTVHRFSPSGVSVVLVLAESHASLHTYPEDGIYYVDIFTCGDSINPENIAYCVMAGIGGDFHVRMLTRDARNVIGRSAFASTP